MRTVLATIPYWKGALILCALLLCLQAPSHAADVTLQWDANTEPDLDGYKVYYKTGSSGAPYNGTGATEGASPIDIGNVTTYKITGLTDGVTYFFAVTAYDDAGDESAYSNEVTTGPESTPTPTATASGGGGGGCFIATAAFGLR